MLDLAPAALFAIFAWWFGTGAVLLLDGLPRHTFPFSLWLGAWVAVAALVMAVSVAGDASVFAAYVGFTAALVVWGWHEMAFLMGVVTGPRKTPCPPEAAGWQRFSAATQAILHHEIALAATLAVLVALTWGAPNQVAAETFAVLWVMRLSAKLNVFLGVRNLATEMIPDSLRYLSTYFGPARGHPFLAASIVLSSAALVLLGARAHTALEATEFSHVGTTLTATLLALAVLEHLFLAFPVRDTWLWRWALRSSRHG